MNPDGGDPFCHFTLGLVTLIDQGSFIEFIENILSTFATKIRSTINLIEHELISRTPNLPRTNRKLLHRILGIALHHHAKPIFEG